MGEVLRKERVVVSGRKIHLELETPELPEGTEVEVVLHPITKENKTLRLIDFFGKGKGLFQNADEVVSFLREGREDPEIEDSKDA